MVKNYLLDTNVLLENPNSIYGFDDNNVWLCGTTMQELDSKKTAPGEVGYNARETCRILDNIRSQGDLVKGVKLPNGGKLLVEPDGVNKDSLPNGFSIEVPDNRIISSCLYLNETKCKKSNIILLTNDISMRINASICGLKVEAVRNDKVEQGSYTGHVELEVEPELIDDIYTQGKVTAGNYGTDLAENEFATLLSGKKSALSIFRDGKFINIKEKTLYGGVHPLNRMQTYAMYALTAPVEEIPLVILQGPAGTSKTYLSLAAGLSQTYLGQGKHRDSLYRKLLISRPNTQRQGEEGFGYLPGDLSDKMGPLLANYTDNLEALVRGDCKDEDAEQIRMQVEDFFDTGIIEICPLSFIRGRSIMNSFIICDEAQNATKGLIRDIVSRAGKDSKVVILGDETQCDAGPSIDRFTNGLVYCATRMKGNPLTAIIRFGEENCVRSPLAEAAIRLM